MKRFFKEFTTFLRNYGVSRRRDTQQQWGINLGFRVRDEQATRSQITIPNDRRAEAVAILGKTGTGKSSLLRYLAKQDIAAGRGFVYFDLHGDATKFLLATIAEQERATKRDLSDKLIVVEPADQEFSVALNPLELNAKSQRFVQIGEFAQVLRERWHLEFFGARTDELLRNSLYVLSENGLTLLELAPLLSHAAFRAKCLEHLVNAEIKQYFALRYDSASEPMRAVMREPILSKISAFTADPHFRHIVGQARSSFSILDALDQGRWIVLNLHKGRLGEQAVTLGSLFLTTIKNSLFSRKKRQLFTLYCDEIQNLVAYGSGLETILSEARKFGVSVVSANQFLDQYPAEMRSAILAVGTHVFFQLSSPDAQQIASALDGGKQLAELLKNLPRRHMIVKTGHERWGEAIVPTVSESKIDFSSLYLRCRAHWGRKRSDIEQDIAHRQTTVGGNTNEVLHDWE
ncbi:MAG: type IV secretion system DNA-binding domain-containing protein [Candidatus Acidiferrales bacterium]